ncbi:MAG: hypothetical protein ACRDKW_02985, partial [Actinomycetota bacterium]
VDASGTSLGWSSYLGGTSSDYGYGVVVDSTGVATVAGDTYSSDFPLAAAFDGTFAGGVEAFVATVDASGASLVSSSYLGGLSSDQGYGLALGSSELYVTGYTYSDDFPTMGGFDSSRGSGDAFVVRTEVCGNGTCYRNEDSCICPADCGPDTCGNGCCGPAEGPCACEQDCPDLCGNGCCGMTEDPCGCPADCGADACGNGCCGDAENACDCEQDCPAVCGDGCCTHEENQCFCPDDCGENTCGNGCCGPGETANNCPADCMALCGDGVCTHEEGCATCPTDCGECTEPGPDGGGANESSGSGCALGRRAGDGGAGALLLLALLALRVRNFVMPGS